jgi:hypothetical protein
MSERGSFRGGRGGGRGGGGERRGAHSTGQNRGGGGGGARDGGGAHRGDQQEKPKKENILDLNKYLDKEVNVKFNGGREGASIFLSIDFSMSVCVCVCVCVCVLTAYSQRHLKRIRPIDEPCAGRCEGENARYTSSIYHPIECITNLLE